MIRPDLDQMEKDEQVFIKSRREYLKTWHSTVEYSNDRNTQSTRILTLIQYARELENKVKIKDEFLEIKSKRSNYTWSERGTDPYMPQDYINEGEIKCAEEALLICEEKNPEIGELINRMLTRSILDDLPSADKEKEE